MSLKKAGLASVVVLALGVASVSSATAEKAIESEGSWYKNGTVLASGEANALAVTCSVGEHEGASKIVGETTVFGHPLKFAATGVTCPSGKIFNESGKAKASTKIKLTGVTVDEPVGCTVAGGSIETVALNSEVWMEENSADKVFQRFAPASGLTIAEIHVEGCAIAGTFLLKGVLFGEFVNATGVEVASQALTLSSAINSTAGGALTVGGSAATLAGRINLALTGGGEWRATAPIMCTEVAVPGTGKFTDAACTMTGAGTFARVMRGAKPLGGGVFCSMTEINGTGTFLDPACTNPGPGNYTATK
jgi:hypothetical protein